MKKIMLCLVAVAIATTGFSQKEKKNITPNAAVKTAFEKMLFFVFFLFNSQYFFIYSAFFI